DKYFVPKVLPDWPFPKHGAHDTYLDVGADLGVVGLVVFLLIFLGAIRGLGSVMRAAESGAAGEGPFCPPPRRAGCWALIGLAVASLGDGLEREKYLWLLIGMAIAVRVWSVVTERTVSETAEHHGLPEPVVHAS